VLANLRPSIVVVASATGYLHRVRDPSSPINVPMREWQSGTREIAATLSSAATSVFWMRDTPFAGFDVVTCLQRSARHSWYSASRCDLPRSTAVSATINAVEDVGLAGLANVRVLDLNAQLCAKQLCPAVLNGRVVYRDDNHLAGGFARSLAPALDRELSAVVR